MCLCAAEKKKEKKTPDGTKFLSPEAASDRLASSK